MILNRDEKTSRRGSDEFTEQFRSSAGLDAVLFGFFDLSRRGFTDQWFSQSPECDEAAISEFRKSVAARVATLVALGTPERSERTARVATDVAADFPIWSGAGRVPLWLGKPLAGTFPVMAMLRPSELVTPEEKALRSVGMAYISQALGKHVVSRPRWPDGLVDATLKMLSIEFFVVTGEGEIRFDGRGDKAGDENGWLVQNSRLSLRPEAERVALRQAMRDAAGEPRRASIISVTQPSGQVRLGVVAPLGDSREKLALVLFESKNTDHAALREHFFKAYGLTRSESSIAHEVLNGKALSDTAETTNLSLSTVRSYMKQIFAKTGTHKQSELIALYYNSIIPVGTSIARAGTRLMG